MAAQNILSLAHPEYYEPLSIRPLSPEYVDRLRALLPTDWALRRDEIWVHAHPRAAEFAPKPIAQGYKIHVSSAPWHAPQVLELIVPALATARVSFKIAGDPVLLHLLNAKLQARGSAGKFMTIYPQDEQIFCGLIEQLYQHTRNEPVKGPYILSDRRYKDSAILFYRYGGFHPPQRLNSDGTRTSCLVSPSGAYVPDQRLPYFQLPDWVSDPFGAGDDTQEADATLLNGRYRVEGALGFSNAGGVYYGSDTTADQAVVIKEARPLTNCWSVGERFWDSVHLLHREYAVMQRLEGLDFVPTLIDLFQEWEHSFLVEERVDGVRLDSFWARDDMILAPYIHREGYIERFLPVFAHIARSLIRMVAAIHKRGVLLGDLSPRNVLINTNTHRLWLIDFESAVFEDDEPEVQAYATSWGTHGFIHPARATRRTLLPEDDLYALGTTLLSCVVPATSLSGLSPGAPGAFFERLVRLGVPDEIQAIIASLQSGDLYAAQALLARWPA